MPLPVDATAPVDVAALRASNEAAVQAAFCELMAWMRNRSPEHQLHAVEAKLWEHLRALALVRLAWWSSLKLESAPPQCLIHRSASYTFHAWRQQPIRARFGKVLAWEPVYARLAGKGPRRLSPHARTLGLAAGRTSLGVHFIAANLIARLPFDEVIEVAG